MSESNIQQAYYSDTATHYDTMHGQENEHYVALSWLIGCIQSYGVQSYLEIGAGTGRTLRHIQAQFKDIRIMGIEPVKELREQGYAKGISSEILVEGDGYHLVFPDASFDVVAEFAVLHHVKQPDLVVAEMVRLARKAVFISDANSFGQGGFFSRYLKRFLHVFGLWPLFYMVKTRGKGYLVSQGDGLFYPSYNIIKTYHQLRKVCPQVFVLNTKPLTDSANPFMSSSTLAILALKSDMINPRPDGS